MNPLVLDLHERLTLAVVNLIELTHEELHQSPLEQARLFGKIEGLKLALSYLEEEIRG